MLTRTLASRALLLRTLANNAKQAKRNGSHGVWSYRVPPPMPSKRAIIISEIGGALCWWWVFWHIFTEPGHIVGEWPFTDPCTWTDEELGVPPDNAGPLNRII